MSLDFLNPIFYRLRKKKEDTNKKIIESAKENTETLKNSIDTGFVKFAKL